MSSVEDKPTVEQTAAVAEPTTNGKRPREEDGKAEEPPQKVQKGVEDQAVTDPVPTAEDSGIPAPVMTTVQQGDAPVVATDAAVPGDIPTDVPGSIPTESAAPVPGVVDLNAGMDDGPELPAPKPRKTSSLLEKLRSKVKQTESLVDQAKVLPKPKTRRRKISKSDQERYPFLSTLSDPLLECWYLLNRVKKHRFAWPFLEPVDAVKLNIPDYYQKIKKPMDFGTITTKISTGLYPTIVSFEQDMKQVFINCHTYNPPGHDVRTMASELERVFNQGFKKAKKAQRYADGLEVALEPSPIPSKPLPEEKPYVPPAPVIHPPQAPTTVIPHHKPIKPKKQKKPPRVLTFDEKRRLSFAIGKLDKFQVNEVVKILEIPPNETKEVEINLNSLDDAKLRKLYKYVTKCINVNSGTKVQGEGSDTDASTDSDSSSDSSSDEDGPIGMSSLSVD